LFFAGTGAVLEVVGVSIDAALIEAWRMRVERAGQRLGWLNLRAVARRHASGASLAMTAPCDQLFVATEVNEWALCAALIERDAARWGGLEQALVAAAADAESSASIASTESWANTASTATTASTENAAAGGDRRRPVIDESAAFARFVKLAADEANPKLRALIDAAALRELPHLLDETELTLGAGSGGRTFALDALPSADDVRWDELHDIPTAIVTGSNGKTTTVRLLAACARAHGWHAGYNCTDGVFLDDELLASGDYSGPAGARRVMRDARAQAAILETARGGILRRGIAVSRADVALVTNVSSDHFGEYGIHDLAGLTQVKLAVAGVLARGGLLVLNADDALLRTHAATISARFGSCPALGWFALNADQPVLLEVRSRGAATCGVRSGHMVLNSGPDEHDLGQVSDMPLSMGGIAGYNVANLAGAALAAIHLGVPADTVREVFMRFGGRPEDNPGRMMRFDVGGVRVLIDYAHNPDGLRGFLEVAERMRDGAGRLGVLLGHAGNRNNADIEELARVAAAFRPDLVVIKENDSQLRGRAAGEVPAIIRAALLRAGISESAMMTRDTETGAARTALEWAHAGDVLAMPLHSLAARAAVIAMLRTS
jgi:cyanophycin synthetase